MAAGLVLRQCMTFISMCGFGYTWREKLFFALAWTPKATVQAALSGGRTLVCAIFHPIELVAVLCD